MTSDGQQRRRIRKRRRLPASATGCAMALLVAACPRDASAGSAADDSGRLARRVALVEELLDENAFGEAVLEARRLEEEAFWIPGALDALSARLANAEKSVPERVRGGKPAPAPGKGFSPGSAFARAVVSFYRHAVSPGIGARCVLEPSCSQYFLDASRKHGLLGIPMIADRFVREPVVSAPDRPVVTGKNGQPRHPDPVEDHDWWFAK